MKPAFKAGILALSALIILVFTVMWLKGKAISGAERITVSFKDVNGMREGAGVHMMGVRIGQVEDITPKINTDEHHVNVKFVITEPDIDIPYASEISIQQSGIIGEQFLEITPPRERIIYIPEPETIKDIEAFKPGAKVSMKLKKLSSSADYYDTGIVKSIETVKTSSLPDVIKENIKTKKAYKVTYTVSMPGLIMPDMLDGKAAKLNKTDKEPKLILSAKDGIIPDYPDTKQPYTIIEPMRIADFLNLQKRSASSLIETNERISMLLSDDVIKDLQETAVNVKTLTEKAEITISKAQELIEASKEELISLSNKADKLADNLLCITDNLNKLAGDEDFVKNINNTASAVTRLSNNISDIMEDKNMRSVLNNIEVITKNTAELSKFVNDMSKDAKLKQYMKESVQKLNLTLDSLRKTLDTINYAAGDKEKIKQAIDDASETSENLRRFSEKLNKRFLIFRLLF